MHQHKNLSTLREGERARVDQLETAGGMRRRLLDLGLIPGAEVLCLQKSPFGDPVAYLVRGAVIALRHEDAATILVSDLAMQPALSRQREGMPIPAAL